MATADPRPSFRFPWQSGHDPDADADGAPGTAVVDRPAWPVSDLVRNRPPAAEPQGDATDMATGIHEWPATDTAGAANGDAAQAGGDAAAQWGDSAQAATTEAPTPGAPAAGTEHAWSQPAGHRKPTKFLADLTRAMRQAADEARSSTIAQFQTDVTSHVDAARAEAESAAAVARQRAEDDVAGLREWSKAEIARIKQETEDGIAGRHSSLDEELARQAGRLDDEIGRVQVRLQEFEAEMEAFFSRLLSEDDPATIAAMAEQLPDPPSLEPWRSDANDAAVASVDAPEAGTAVETSDAAVETADNQSEALAANADGTTTDAGAEGGLPPMLPDDFAAAEAQAAAWAGEEPEASGDPVDVGDPAAEAGATEGVATDSADAPAEPVRTQIVVVGLVSVASIASFKRLLARTSGVRGVQVSSGPDGEFLFNTTHDAGLDIGPVVEGLPGFEVGIVDSNPGVISVIASDPLPA